jgi:hypothetical protein
MLNLKKFLSDSLKSKLKFFYLIIVNNINQYPFLSSNPCKRKVIKVINNDLLNNTIFSTSSGLFLIINSELIRILKGKFYGIVKYQKYWIVIRQNNTENKSKVIKKNNRQSDVLAIVFHKGMVVSLKTLIFGIPGEVHQIDIVDDELYLPHTGYNQIIKIKLKKMFKSNYKPKSFLSCDLISLAHTNIKKPSHLNSIFFSYKSGLFYLMAHNSTAHTGKFSDIIISNNSNFTKCKIINTKGHSCHNVCEYNNSLLYLDSNNGKAMYDENIIFESDTLLRGLSITDRYVYIGGSSIDFTSKNNRKDSDSFIYIITIDGRLLHTERFFKIGNIYEIRNFFGEDFAMS